MAPGYVAPGARVELERAGFGIRLGGYLLDGLLYGILGALFTVPGFFLIANAFSDCVSIDDTIVCPAGSPDGAKIGGGIALILVGFVIVFVIYVRAMGKTGQTWGRKIVGIKVVGENTDEPIGVGKAVGRTLFAAVFSTYIFYLGYFWMIWDSKKQTWHDKVVSSKVVKL